MADKEYIPHGEYLKQKQAKRAAIQPLSVMVLAYEVELIEEAIDLCDGNYEAAAIALRVSRQTIWRKLGKKPIQGEPNASR